MVERLRSEIRQEKPFGSLEEEAYLNLQRTAAVMSQDFLKLLKPSGLSPAQYNMLRILRGAGPEGLPCKDIGERMIARDPDVTRLLDRLEKSELAERRRESSDRRVITVRITRKGMSVLRALDAPVAELHLAQMAHMEKRDLKALVGLLESARSRGT
jgi:DNA-binding MarR family transcriptional regulator